MTNLTEQQLTAIHHQGGPARILAGAGTGKTRVIVARFHHLVAQGVRPERILVLTFSREAVRSLREAILPGLGAAARLWVSTFHSFCLKVLEGEGVGLRLAQEPERLAMLASLTSAPAEPPARPWTHYTGTRASLLPAEALAFIGQAKDYLLSPLDVARYAEATGDARLADLAQAYDLYQAELERLGAADFGDYISRAVALLEANPAPWQSRFDHILVDEFQDTNLAQFRVLQILAQPHGNLMVVGDDDQAIYHFRGASDRYLIDWERYYPNSATHKVEENFRCPAPVLEAANQLIQRNTGRVGKQLYTTTKCEGYPAVRHWEAQSERDEADSVAAEIAARVHRGEASPSDFAILCRSLRRTGPEFARALVRRGIPCRTVGEERPHPLTQQTLALLRLTRGLTATDLLQVMAGRVPPHELYAQLRAGSLAPDPALLDWLNTYGHADIPTQVYQGLRFLGHLRLSLMPTTAEIDRLMAARSLQERAAEAQSLEELAEPASVAATGEAVTLMTIHAAKGLQFPTVFVVGLANGIFPVAVDTAPVFYTADSIRNWVDGATAASPSAGERLLQHLREERRLAYVALTRAERELILTRARQYGQELAEPSPFLAELGAPAPERLRLTDPLPDARSFLLKVAAGLDPGEPDRVAQAAALLSRDPLAVPLRRQAPPSPFVGGESLRLSATALEAYKECPRRYYYAQVLRLPDEDNIALAFGDAMHTALERYNRALMAGNQPAWPELEAWLAEGLDPARCQSAGQHAQLLQRGRTFLERYHRWAQGRWRRIIGVEERFEAPYTDAQGRIHQVVGRYDLIAEADDGAIEIVDYKTGKRSSVVNKRITKGSDKNPQAKLQLGLYYLARFGGEVDPNARVMYIFLRHEEDEYPSGLLPDFDPGEQAIATTHSAESLAAIRTRVNEIIDGILANRFDRTDDTSKCERCPFRNVCEVTPLDWY